jgi:hypothetical protein
MPSDVSKMARKNIAKISNTPTVVMAPNKIVERVQREQL